VAATRLSHQQNLTLVLQHCGVGRQPRRLWAALLPSCRRASPGTRVLGATAKRARHLDRSFSEAEPNLGVIAVNRSFKPLRSAIPVADFSGATADPTGASTIPHTRRSALLRETAICGPWGWKGYTPGSREEQEKKRPNKEKLTPQKKTWSHGWDSELTTQYYPLRSSASCSKSLCVLQLRNLIDPLSRIGPQAGGHGTLDTPTQDPIR
jgi:hypothetical protein